MTGSACNHTATDPANYYRLAQQQVFVGQDYLISAGTQGTPTQGPATIQLTCDPEVYDVPNDECSSALAISEGNITFEPTQATDSYNALPYPIRRDSWFIYTATCSGAATIAIVEDSSISYASLVAYTNNCSVGKGLTQVMSGLGALHNFVVVAGSAYLIRAGTPIAFPRCD